MDFHLEGEENAYLIPPYLSERKEYFIKEWQNLNLNSHVFLFSSGTMGRFPKSYAISFQAMKNNASAVNDFLGNPKKPIWYNSLPIYHIGGLSIFIRAQISGGTVIKKSFKSWDSVKLIQDLENNKVEFLSLVPTQVYDLVAQKLKAPSNIKGVFVGGDFLSKTLAKKFSALGWPVILTYGMTETSSQIASSFYDVECEDNYLEVLPIHDIVGQHIHSQSLFTARINFSKKTEVFWQKSNSMELLDSIAVEKRGEKTFIKPLGRVDDAIKIKGRLYHMSELKEYFHRIFMENNIFGNAEIFTAKCSQTNENRLQVHLPNKSLNMADIVLGELKRDNPSLIEKLDFKYLESIEKTSLGKIKKNI